MSTFYHGDCLLVMQHDIPAESVDLIYLDPPFFTGKVQKGSWQPGAMEISFDDSRRFWSEQQGDMQQNSPQWMRHLALERPDFASYTFYMDRRLRECRRVLKQTGSIYLHCDWRASHYLKMVMDEIFGHKQFQNEIIWYYRGAGVPKTRFARRHDTIYFYSKSSNFRFDPDPARMPYAAATTERFSHHIGNVRGGRDYGVQTLNPKGKHPDDVWNDIQPIAPSAKARTGFPTQKPIELLERIIRTSSVEGDVVLDPFCGCGTTAIAASGLAREWIGIDIDSSPREKGKFPTAFDVIRNRSHSLFEEATYISRDLGEIAEMDGYGFEGWVNEFYRATKPSPDKVIDGFMQDGTPIQVKTYEIKYPVLSQFITDARYHPNVPQPVKRIKAVSQTGFDDGARRRKFEIETAEGIEVELVTPAEMLTIAAPS